MEYIDPTIVGLVTAWTAGVLRFIYIFHKEELSKYSKMVIACAVGAAIGVWLRSDLVTLESVLEGLKIGFISGFSATTGYAAIKNIFKTKTLNLPV